MQGNARPDGTAPTLDSAAPRPVLGPSFLAVGGIVNNLDIKRQLGVGVATLADHLRDYKDPFEPSDTPPPAGAVSDIDFQLFLLLIGHGDGVVSRGSDASRASSPSGNAA